MTHSSGASTVSNIRSSVVGELFVHRWGGDQPVCRWSPTCSGLVGGASGLVTAMRTNGVGNVVDSAWGPGMAAQEASGCEPGTTYEAEPLDGGQRIGRTGWVEPTRRRPHGRHNQLVGLDQPDRGGSDHGTYGRNRHTSLSVLPVTQPGARPWPVACPAPGPQRWSAYPADQRSLGQPRRHRPAGDLCDCLLYTSDAADE